MSQRPRHRREFHPRVKYIGGPIPEFGYGFLLRTENREHFARYAQKVQGKDALPPHEAEQFRSMVVACAKSLLPGYMFHARPTMAPVRSHLVLAYDEHGGFGDLFILCDDGSPATKDVVIHDDDLDFVKEHLGIPPTTQPRWYEICQGTWSNFAA